MNKEYRPAKKKFKPQWFKIKQFKLWLHETPHDEQFVKKSVLSPCVKKYGY